MSTSERIWQEYHAKLRVFIRSRVPDDATSDDILQNVFLKMDTGLTLLKDKTKIKSWIYQITRNAINDYFRFQKPAIELPEGLSQADADLDEKVKQELSECLEPMIQMLPEKYREAVILSELKGLTQKDLAKVQGISISGAKSRVQRGRVLLKKMIEECCQLEFDHKGRLCNYERRNGAGDAC